MELRVSNLRLAIRLDTRASLNSNSYWALSTSAVSLNVRLDNACVSAGQRARRRAEKEIDQRAVKIRRERFVCRGAHRAPVVFKAASLFI